MYMSSLFLFLGSYESRTDLAANVNKEINKLFHYCHWIGSVTLAYVAGACEESITHQHAFLKLNANVVAECMRQFYANMT
ncbi:hypothetical protein BLOT_009335 [Blomia tropicalis]|nr:hypothetical protein BLOT_009335 [Blomia tropicalis]